MGARFARLERERVQAGDGRQRELEQRSNRHATAGGSERESGFQLGIYVDDALDRGGARAAITRPFGAAD